MPRPHKIQIVQRRIKRAGRKDKILYYARVTYTVAGRRKAIWRAGVNKTEARDRLTEALKERETLTIGGRFHPQSRFGAVMDWYLKTYVVAPIYRNDRKISGLRSAKTIKALSKPLKAFFGDIPISRISHSDLEVYRKERLAAPTIREKDDKGNPVGVRSIASVNRELALARRVFNIAERDGWINRSPFRKGHTLISQADEHRGTRVLSIDEESRLIEAARDYLKPIIICALDTGMRRAEILTLKWADVDLEGHRITLSALNTKTLRSRVVPISQRLLVELRNLWDKHDEDESRVFGLSEVKRTWTAACKKAGLERGPDGVSFRCLRRTCATRWLQGGLPRESVSKLLGHATPEITYRHYLSADEVTLKQAEAILNLTDAQPERNSKLIGSSF